MQVTNVNFFMLMDYVDYNIFLFKTVVLDSPITPIIQIISSNYCLYLNNILNLGKINVFF